MKAKTRIQTTAGEILVQEEYAEVVRRYQRALVTFNPVMEVRSALGGYYISKAGEGKITVVVESIVSIGETHG